MKRRELIQDFLLALATVPITLVITRCGNTTVSVGGVTATIADNHGHTATLSETQLTTAAAIELDIAGASSHTHTISVTAAEMVSIKAGTQVAKTSTSGGGHTHAVTFN